MSNPLIIILETLYFIIKSITEAIFFIILKTLEFFESIVGTATLSLENALIGSFTAGLFLFFIVKYIFGLSKELLVIMVIYFFLIVIMIIYKTIL